MRAATGLWRWRGGLGRGRGHTWAYSGMRGHPDPRACVAILGHTRACVGILGHAWPYSGILGHAWAYVGVGGLRASACGHGGGGRAGPSAAVRGRVRACEVCAGAGERGRDRANACGRVRGTCEIVRACANDRACEVRASVCEVRGESCGQGRPRAAEGGRGCGRVRPDAAGCGRAGAGGASGMACGPVRGRYRRAAERARSAAGGVRGSCGARARCVRDRANACAGRAGSGVVRPSAAACECEGRAHRANACECVRARWKAAGGGRPGLGAAVRGRMRWGAEGAAECGRMRPSAGSLGRMRLGWVACVRVGPNAVELTGGCARRWRRLPLPTRRLPPRVPTQAWGGSAAPIELGASRGFAGAGATCAGALGFGLVAFDEPGLTDETACVCVLRLLDVRASAATVLGVGGAVSPRAAAPAAPRGFPCAGDPARLGPGPSLVSDGGDDAGLPRSRDDAVDARKGSSACEGVCATGRAACAKVLAYFDER